MKNKALPIVLLLTALISTIVVILKLSFAEIFGSIVCFPFEQIGILLRMLSLKGGIHNIFAIVVYTILSIAPLLLLLQKAKKKSRKIEDYILILLSFLLFYLLYMMVNPGLIPVQGVLGMGSTIGKSLLCGTVYSLIVTYLVLKAIRVFFESQTRRLYEFMILLLSITAILLTVLIFGSGLNELITQIEVIKAANTGNESGLLHTYIFAVIKFILNSIPSAVNILVIFKGIKLINEFLVDPYSETAILASENLSSVCKIGLIVTVCLNTAFNILQLLFINNLRSIDSLIQIPLFSIIFVLGALIFSRMVMANKTLKDDNDSIV